MLYKPVTGVWEITMGCNMRCKHCGSSCESALEGELSTSEALDLCKQIGDLGFEFITLSGGEPTTRKDFDLLAQELNNNNVKVTMISNGWLIDDKMAKRIKSAGISTVAISIDGFDEEHDKMRREGSFQKSIESFKHLKDNGILTSAVTTINKKNILELNKIREFLISIGVSFWQLQIAIPMGNFKKESDELLLDPSSIDDIIDFAYANLDDDRILIDLADCIGYYNSKGIAVKNKRANSENNFWHGCGAGKTSLGILHNGDIVGCTSVREKKFFAGNIKSKSLKEIWKDDSSFSTFRNLNKTNLTGFCKKCNYGDYCLGGCPNVRLSTEGDIYSENKYCSYRNTVEKEITRFSKIPKLNTLEKEAFTALEDNKFQVAQLAFEELLKRDENNPKYLSPLGFCHYSMNNFEEAISVNKTLLDLNEESAFAHKALGLSLYKANDKKNAFKHLYKGASLCDSNYMDPYFDLIITLKEDGQIEEAKKAYEKALELSNNFEEKYGNPLI